MKDEATDRELIARLLPALWSAIGGGFSALGPLAAGFLLEHFWWGSVFLITLPLAALALVLLFLWLAIRLIRQLFRGAPPPSGQR